MLRSVEQGGLALPNREFQRAFGDISVGDMAMSPKLHKQWSHGSKISPASPASGQRATLRMRHLSVCSKKWGSRAKDDCGATPFVPTCPRRRVTPSSLPGCETRIRNCNRGNLSFWSRIQIGRRTPMKAEDIAHIYRDGRRYDRSFEPPYMPFWLDLAHQLDGPIRSLPRCG
jgi:hypothetical protein